MSRIPDKTELHPRNRFRGGYDFPRLIQTCPALADYMTVNRYGGESLDFANPEAVKLLNAALLRSAYGLTHWDIPPGYLCPPIPGRSDYIHHVADLLTERPGASPPRGCGVRILDIGTGANCIYPLIGSSEYGWSFVATDIDPAALAWARKLVGKNPSVDGLIECQFQTSPRECFAGIIRPGEFFHASMCNPPFFASAQEAAAGTQRKLRNLGKAKPGQRENPERNFGGKGGELWCPGGELSFVRRMILQSVAYRRQCGWFTCLISKSIHLRALQETLQATRPGPPEIRTLEMGQGQKKSRILAWSWSAVAEA